MKYSIVVFSLICIFSIVVCFDPPRPRPRRPRPSREWPPRHDSRERPASWEDDWDIDEMSTEAPPQCPGVQIPYTNAYFAYDKRYQAETIEEAVLNFPDLTDPDWAAEEVTETNKTQADSDQINGGTKVCETAQCVACARDMTSKMVEEGFISAKEGQTVMSNTNPNKIAPSECKKYRFNQQFQPAVKGDTTAVEQCLAKLPKSQKRGSRGNRGGRGGRKGGRGGQGRRNGDRGPSPNRKGRQGQRRRNENWDRNPGFSRQRRVKRSNIGTTWTIGCVKRGDPERYGDQSTVVLCNMCWKWRVLPAEYFPRYINELECDNDNSCLSGYGKCEQRDQNLNILRNTGGSSTNPQWQSTTVSTGSCCDCKISYGSTLHAFVSR